jgi:hypothetical protein
VCRDLGIGSILVLPILHEKAVIGVLEVLSEQAHAFSASHIQWLKEVTELIGAVWLSTSVPTARIAPPAPPAGLDQPMNDKESKPVLASDSFEDRGAQCNSERTEIEAIPRRLAASVGNNNLGRYPAEIGCIVGKAALSFATGTGKAVRS